MSVLLDVRGEALPAVVHWGADLGDLDQDAADALVLAEIAPGGPNEPALPIRISLLPEHAAGWLGRPGLSGSRAGRAWSPAWQVTSLHGDDTALTIDAQDEATELTLRVRLGLLPGGVLRMSGEVTNTGHDDYQLDGFVLALPVPDRAAELLDFAGRWGRERSPQRRPFQVGTWLREGRHGRTGADAVTVLHAGVPGFDFGSGEVWALHTGWSGNHTSYAERLWTGAQVLGGGELLWPGEVVLAPGEAYVIPCLYATYGDGLDEVARRFHRYLRSRDQHVDTERPVTLNVWEAVYFDHDLDRLTALAERAAQLGVERYVLDDGWFGARRDDHAGLGDWTVSADVWPDGLHPLVDRVVALGMEFGLWFEPEMINPDSDLARAHPEWIMQVPGRMPLESRQQQVLNLSIPRCWEHIRASMQAILDEYAIGYIKWDHNRDLIDAGTAPEGRPATHDQTIATYRLLERLKADNPGLEIESCSSGGARVDLGVLEHTDRVWVSDCIDPHERQMMNRWTTQLIPPELMGSHIASGRSHTTSREHDLDYRAATAVFGHLGIEWDLTGATDDELDALAGWIAFYKAERPLLLGGEVVRLDLADPSLHAHGVLAADRSQAIISWSAIDRSDVVHAGRLVVPGLDPERRYRVRPFTVGPVPRGLRTPPWFGERGDDGAWAGVSVTGRALAAAGLRAPDLDPDHSVLFLID